MSEPPGPRPGPGFDPPPAAVLLSPEQLAHLNRLTTLARLVSGLAHELNNSLQVVGGLVDVLADRTDLPADAARRIQTIGAQADRATDAIRQVLSFLREGESEAGAVDVGAVDVGLIVDGVLRLRRYAIARARIALDVQKAPGERYRVMGDARQLQQVVLNLLVNAEEALAGTAEPRVAVSLRQADGRVRLAIADSGEGVAAGLRERIFDPFFTTKASQGAVGLGLTVSAAIVARHGGHLALAESGSGATFVVHLPAE